MSTFDFGEGPVPAKQHPNGGGWVADTATVESTVYVEPNAWVFGDAEVYDNAQVSGTARVYGTARVSGNACVSGRSFNGVVKEEPEIEEPMTFVKFMRSRG